MCQDEEGASCPWSGEHARIGAERTLTPPTWTFPAALARSRRFSLASGLRAQAAVNRLTRRTSGIAYEARLDRRLTGPVMRTSTPDPSPRLRHTTGCRLTITWA